MTELAGENYKIAEIDLSDNNIFDLRELQVLNQ